MAVVTIDKFRDSDVRSYALKKKVTTRCSVGMWFSRRGPEGVWYLGGDKVMDAATRESVFAKAGECARILEGLFEVKEITYINLNPEIANPCAVFVRKKPWHPWWKLQPQIFKVLARAGFSNAGIDLHSA
jgi:hypothetical protein